MATLEARRQGIGDLKTLRKRSNREYYMQCLKILPPLYPFLKKLLENVSQENKAIKKNQENGLPSRITSQMILYHSLDKLKIGNSNQERKGISSRLFREF